LNEKRLNRQTNRGNEREKPVITTQLSSTDGSSSRNAHIGERSSNQIGGEEKKIATKAKNQDKLNCPWWKENQTEKECPQGGTVFLAKKNRNDPGWKIHE